MLGFGRKNSRDARKSGTPDICIDEKNNPGHATERLEDILGYKVETVRNDIAAIRQTPVNARSRVSLVPRADTEGQLTSKILDGYREINSICPTAAVTVTDTKTVKQTVTLDEGKCVLCGRCQEISPQLIKIENTFTPPVRKRHELITSIPSIDSAHTPSSESFEKTGEDLKEKISKTLGKSLAIREVDAGSCNGCEVEITALNNPIYDVERFGIHFVASPRHADVLLVTGPASRNMEIALRRTYDAMPDPKIVVAVGACACSGGIFGDTYATTGGIEKVVPVDVFVPGCPPRPEALLYGLLLSVDRIKARHELKSRL